MWQARWSFVQLQKETDQPAVWLKEVLGDVAILNKRGPHAKLYELKREYRVASNNGNDTEMPDA
jgi:transcription initiation factor TFIIF subunit beta